MVVEMAKRLHTIAVNHEDLNDSLTALCKLDLEIDRSTSVSLDAAFRIGDVGRVMARYLQTVKLERDERSQKRAAVRLCFHLVACGVE